MTNRLTGLALFFFLSVFAPVARADKTPAADTSTIKVEPGKRYIYKKSGGKPRAMEIYFPPGWSPARKVPGVLLFHGGGWVAGDLRQFRYECKYLASRGLVAATVDYQMNPFSAKTALKPAGAYIRVCVTDGKSAIRWMKQHAAELGVDPDRIIVGGGSAGGGVAVLATVTPGLNDPGDPPGIDTKVAAYLLFCPGYFPPGMKIEDGEVDVYKQLKSALAPAIFFHGTIDFCLPQTMKLIKQSRALGDHDAELWLAKDQRHGFFNRQPWTDLTLAEADRFLVKHGLLTGPGPLTPPSTGEKLMKAP